MSVTISGDGTITGTTGFLYAGTRYYTSSGTFAKADPLGTGDIGLRAIRVRVQGGGGGAGGTPATGAGEDAVSSGGGGGGYAESLITDIAGLAASVTVTRGAGGAGGVGGAAGTAGGQSSFGATVLGDGGGAGAAGVARSAGSNASLGRADVAGGTGDLVVNGEGTSVAVSNTNAATGGAGGPSYLGQGGLHGGVIGGVFGGGNGLDGLQGGGGGGTGSGASTAARNGGAGGNGIVIVDCFV